MPQVNEDPANTGMPHWSFVDSRSSYKYASTTRRNSGFAPSALLHILPAITFID